MSKPKDYAIRNGMDEEHGDWDRSVPVEMSLEEMTDE